jgi:hypothetical protein
MTRRRVVVAFAFAPLVVPLVLLVLALIFPDPHQQWYAREVLTEKGRGEGLAIWMVVASVYSLPVAYWFELMLGIPLWLVFRHFRIRSVSAFAACGGLIGSLVVPSAAMWSGRAPETSLNPQSPDWFRSFAMDIGKSSETALNPLSPGWFSSLSSSSWYLPLLPLSCSGSFSFQGGRSALTVAVIGQRLRRDRHCRLKSWLPSENIESLRTAHFAAAIFR